MTKTAFILIGAPGSGKSTITKALRAQYNTGTFEVFSQDWCYEAFMNSQHAGQWWSDRDDAKSIYRQSFEYMKAHQKEFDEFMSARWRECLRADTLIVDRTNLTRKSRARYIVEAKQKGFMIWAIQVLLPLQTCLDRQSSRYDKDVPLNVVQDMYMNQQEVLVGDEVDALLVVDGTVPFTIATSAIHQL